MKASNAIAGLHGTGLGLRREFIDSLKSRVPAVIDYFEIAPENWIDMGGAFARDLRHFTERYPFVCHGLSLSLGGPHPLDEVFLQRIKSFLDQYRIKLYTEHLSYCGDDGQLYDLLPIPFTEEAVHYVAARIRRVQEILERKIAVENASFYCLPSINEMSETEFVNAVLAEADCLLHLDVNNIYVNSVNHCFDAEEYLNDLPAERVAYIHVAGHYNEALGLIVDTHGADVIDPVWRLLDLAYANFGVQPTTLERDFNMPPIPELAKELKHIARLQEKWQRKERVLHAQSA